MNKINTHILFALLILNQSCEFGNDESDAFGNFEATEILISSESNGKLLDFQLEEGDLIKAGEKVGLVDTIGLHLRKKQLEAKIRSLSHKTLDIPSQINVLIERKSNLEREKNRIENLYRDGAATQKQWDDIRGELDVIESEILANRERLQTNNAGLMSEILPLQYQVEEINDQINKAVLLNPVTGIVLTKFAEAHEVVSFGKPLYRIADMEEVILRAYISGKQLDDIRLGQQVTVLIDQNESEFKTYNGKISWISEKAEFTPKIVQTKEERVNLVYAIKILVKNDGFIKIGMPGEVKFSEVL
ncbi:MAG: HlyD family efflux transporter periplasmic adaptor subunit [Cyclobacteriaceae bacterium]|nr:HlyD family efflux transporter periplasmic adaptor subunit [Cyclobacteriaceae bacterium]